MFKRLKTINLLLAITIALFAFACNKGDDYVPRTPEMEAAELQQLLDQIDESGDEVFTTDLGIYYLVDSLGDGDLVQMGDTCNLEYVGYLTNGSIFDAGTLDFAYMDPEYPLIPGFEDGIGVMNKGARITMIIPSDLAYGSGKGPIPPYSTLIFYTEMHDVKPLL